MKKKLAVLGLCSIIIVCFSITFRNLAPVQDDGYRSTRERAIIKKFDKDGDGELSKRERAEAERAFAKERQDYIQKFDKNGDGKISAEEKEAAKKMNLNKKTIFKNRTKKNEDDLSNKITEKATESSQKE